MSELKPVAWLHCDRPDADVVTDKVKNVWGGVVLGSLAQYSIPLYTGEVFERCLSDIAALKKAHREAVEFSNDLLIENGELKNINAELEYEIEVMRERTESLEDFCRLEIRKLPPEYVKYKQGTI